MNTYIFIIVLFIGYVNIAKAQVLEEDLEYIFKQWLFLDKKIIDNTSLNKNDSTFSVFNNSLDLNLEFLKNTSLGEHYLVINLHYYDNSIKDFVENAYTYKEGVDSGSELLAISVNYTIEKYTIIYNSKNKKSYRIIGFNSNDFLSFLSDFKEEERTKYSGKEISTRDFFKNYQVEGIDFKCLYKGLRKRKLNRNKFPCLIRGSEFVLI